MVAITKITPCVCVETLYIIVGSHGDRLDAKQFHPGVGIMQAIQQSVKSIHDIIVTSRSFFAMNFADHRDVFSLPLLL